jgi:hypothetical protein
MLLHSGPNFGALETAQQSMGIPESDPPGQSGFSIVGSFLSHGRTDLRRGRMIILWISFPGKATRRGRNGRI